jgi:hypothetical protein
MQLIPPPIDRCIEAIRLAGRRIDYIVGVPHEGVERFHGATLFAGQNFNALVEI